MKHIELKLAALSVGLIAIGFFIFPVVAEWLHTSDEGLAELVAFPVGVALMIVGAAFGIGSIGVLFFRLRDR
jgi:hypothetical protein